MGNPYDGRAQQVRESVLTTEAAGTARLRYVTRMVSALPSLVNALTASHPTPAAAARLLGRASRRITGERVELPGPDGVIDFTNRRTMYSRGAFWRLLADGQEYDGHPGEWWVGPMESLCDENPFWLLTLLASTSHVTGEAEEKVRGARCHRYDGFADFAHARDRTELEFVVPLHAVQQDPTRFPVQVWVDPAGRIREAVYWGHDDHQTRIQLSDYGIPGPLDVPKEHELAPDED